MTTEKTIHFRITVNPRDSKEDRAIAVNRIQSFVADSEMKILLSSKRGINVETTEAKFREIFRALPDENLFQLPKELKESAWSLYIPTKPDFF